MQAISIVSLTKIFRTCLQNKYQGSGHGMQQTKTRSIQLVCEHFESFHNAAPWVLEAIFEMYSINYAGRGIYPSVMGIL